MTIEIGDKLPQATLLKMVDGQPAEMTTEALFGKGRHAIIGMPGAFTGTCSALHLPNIVSHAAELRSRGLDSLSVLTVNDPFALTAWGKGMGTEEAGIELVADAGAELSLAMGLTFTLPARGFYNRSTRYSMLVEDGVVTRLNREPPNSACDISGGEVLLEQLT